MRTIRIGSGAGYSGDRIEPAVELAEKGNIQYLGFECLAERTIALAQHARMRDPEAGYDPLLERRMRAVLRICRSNKIRIITNMGAANPRAAARKTAEIARNLGISNLKIAAVTGDDVLDVCKRHDFPLMETGGRVGDLKDRILSANAYLGAAPIVQALKEGADVVITGRAADPSLFLAPLIHEFDWSHDDWTKLGRGVLVGHLLECAGQVTGGYFCDPGFKDVEGLAYLGFPIGEVTEDGNVVITKVDGSGGAVTEATCKEQMLYEVHDPANYVQPDVVADFSNVSITQIGPDRVHITGATGKPATGHLKASIGYVDSYIGEGQMSYAGPGASQRAALALEIVERRLQLCGVRLTESRFELIGVDALHGHTLSSGHPPYEARIRAVGRTDSLDDAVLVGNEVEALYTNGPAGGAGSFKSAREIIAVVSTLVPKSMVAQEIEFHES
ncbi:acyclic terpene utilization AtuA family protein [Bradyrhizobium cenepequi]